MLTDTPPNLPAATAVPYSLAVLDEDGVILTTNQTWQAIGERSLADPSRCGPGTSYYQICELATDDSASDARAVAHAIRQVAQGVREHASLAYQCVVPGVGSRWFEVRIHALGIGSPRHVVIVHHDITEARLEGLHTEERGLQLASLVESIRDFGIFVLDDTGRIRTWNSGAQHLTGYDASDVAGMSFDHFFTPEDRTAGIPAQHLREARDEPLRSRGWRLRKDGSKVFVFSTLYPLKDYRGRLLGYAMIVGDVTDLHQAEAALGQAVTEVQLRNRDLEQFVYTVSHDLKTPLVTIAGFSSHLREDLIRGRLDRLPAFVDRVVAATERMGETIDDLLKLSQLGTIEADCQAIDAARMLAQTLAEMDQAIVDRGASITVSSPRTTLWADPTCLREVLENLIGNALKHGCPRPGMTVEISIRQTQGEDLSRAQLIVRDHGPGIPRESRQRVFGLFQRMSNSTEGTGVGLAIVKRIAELHGGDARIEDPPPGEQGAVFVVEFPSRPPERVT